MKKQEIWLLKKKLTDHLTGHRTWPGANGVVIDGQLYGSETNANQWFTDGYGDYIRHFMTGMGAVPEWSPANQTHLLRSSSVM